MGNSVLGIGFSIFLAEGILASFIPSNTARGGTIMLPVVESMISSFADPTISTYLVLCGSHANLLSSSLFLTAVG